MNIPLIYLKNALGEKNDNYKCHRGLLCDTTHSLPMENGLCANCGGMKYEAEIDRSVPVPCEWVPIRLQTEEPKVSLTDNKWIYAKLAIPNHLQKCWIYTEGWGIIPATFYQQDCFNRPNMFVTFGGGHISISEVTHYQTMYVPEPPKDLST